MIYKLHKPKECFLCCELTERKDGENVFLEVTDINSIAFVCLQCMRRLEE